MNYLQQIYFFDICRIFQSYTMSEMHSKHLAQSCSIDHIFFILAFFSLFLLELLLAFKIRIKSNQKYS